MFIDSVDITVIAGNGGSGAATFRRTAQTAFGGPDGGNGGNGGNIYVQGSVHIRDLSAFRFKKTIEAEQGAHGTKHNGFGKNAAHTTIFVPIGTRITDTDTGDIIDILDTDTRILVAEGGKGGKGNVFFKSPTNRAPENKEPGGTGQQKHIHLELYLIAKIGLVGLPNAGKSSLLAALTRARPAIAPYPFTTLEPSIGMLDGYAIADIPGLIEGASNGKGLGIQFLKHIEKTEVLIHCIDCTNTDVCKAYNTVRNEFKNYNPELMQKKELIYLNKTDLIDENIVQKLINELKHLNPEIVAGSVYSQKTLSTLTSRIFSMLR